MATQETIQQIRAAAEADLETFIRLVAPKQVLGHVHVDVCRWWTRQGAKDHQLLLLPRDHGKSRLAAFRVAWEITRHPWVRILYISSTAPLAEAQLQFIKDILESEQYRRYWPEMVNPDKNKRTKWTSSEISVDHPLRKQEQVRDSTIFTGGLTTSLTGFHCDIAVLDDIVVMENAYNNEGRSKVESQYSLLSSIESTDCQEWVVGTRYSPNDLYGKMVAMNSEIYDDAGELIDVEPVYEVFQRAVENRGDGTGEYIWPRTQRSDGRWFGFNANILAKKRAKYIDKTQFFAQYYNDPNDPSSSRFDPDLFQYYDPKFLEYSNGDWFFGDYKLNIFAAIDFAYSLSNRADYTCLVVVGVDCNKNYYILEIKRFRTDRISEYYDNILSAYSKWGFRKIRCETTAAQQAIVKELKESYIKPNGLSLTIEEFKPQTIKDSKMLHIDAVLKPLYELQQVWHYRSGNCQVLEEELIAQRPPHDDVSDALASCIEICQVPSARWHNSRKNGETNIVRFHPRFGGLAF